MPSQQQQQQQQLEYMEVPLLFPSLETEAPLYLVDDVGESVALGGGAAGASSTAPPRSPYADSRVLRGAASASTIYCGDSGGANNSKRSTGPIIITTGLLPERPWILSVSALRRAAADDDDDDVAADSPVTVHLDLISRTRVFQEIVCLRAFARRDESSIRLVLVDSNAAILTLRLDSSTLEPCEVSFIDCVELLGEDRAALVTPNSLASSMVAFCGSTHVVLGLRPYLLSVGIADDGGAAVRGDAATISVWSYGMTKERMNPSRKSLGYRLLDIVVGSGLDEDETYDMPPVSAMTSATGSEEDDSRLIFTLHADKSIRLWTLPVLQAGSARKLYPSAVADLAIQADALPPPELWNDDASRYPTTVMSARLCPPRNVEFGDDQFVLALNIQVGAPFSSSDDGCHLCVLSGPVDPGQAVLEPVLVRAVVPDTATGLIGLAFVEQVDGARDHRHRCSVQALFGCRSGTSILATYPSSATDSGAINPVPIVQHSPERGLLLDHVAVQECNRIELLSYASADTLDLPLQDALHRIDQGFLHYLFRPTSPKGTGSVLPPTPPVIRRTLQKLVRDYSSGNDASLTNIELETLRALHEWRHRDNRKPVSTSLKIRSTPAHGEARMVATTPHGSSIYASIGEPEQEEFESEIEYGEEEDDTEDRDKEQQIEAHETRWRALLLEISNEESTERLPLGLASSLEYDDVLLLRAGSTSALARVPATTASAALTLASFDKYAVSILEAVNSDGESREKLSHLEQKLASVAAGAQLALRKDRGSQVEWISQFEQLANAKESAFASKLESDRALVGLFEATGADLFAAFEKAPTERNLPGLCFVSPHDLIVSQTASVPVVEDPGRQVRLAASSFAVRSLDSARRILLGRLLLLPLSPFEADIDLLITTTLRMYLQTMAVIWTVAQHVPLPRTFPSSDVSTFSSSPPKKRLSFTSTTSSIFVGVPDNTSALDAFLLRRRHTSDDSKRQYGASSSTVALGSTAAATCLRFAPIDNTTGLPELGLLEPTPSLQPRLATRLLAPPDAFPRPEEDHKLLTRRSELLAECLLASVHFTADDTRAAAMADRAFELLAFNTNDVSRSMEHLNTLNRLVGESPMLASKFLGFIKQAIIDTEQKFPRDIVRSMGSYITLWSTLFNTAIVVQEWAEAFRCCVHQSNGFSRLIRSMVDAGYLGELLLMCNSKSDVSVAAFSQGYDLYEIAVETLGTTAMRDLYTFRASESSPPSDYHGALCALHASEGDWRHVAEALDLIHAGAIDALKNGSLSEGDPDSVVAYKREGLIVDDLLLSSLGSFLAISLVSDEHCRFVVAGDGDSLSSGSGKSFSSPKRFRDSAIDSPASSTGLSPGLSSRYMGLNDLEVRATMTSVLSTLFYDDSVDPSTPKAALLAGRELDDAALEDAVGALFAAGYYQGVIISGALSRAKGGKEYGRSFLHESFSLLLGDFLVPLAIDLSDAPARPSLRQIEQALGYLSIGKAPGLPSLLEDTRSKKGSALLLSTIRLGAMNLIKCICERYSTADMNLAVEAAHLLLTTGTGVVLPPWLESFLLLGRSDAEAADPGLFAIRPRGGTGPRPTYLGDPTALLSLYIQLGRYNDACRIVAAALEGPSATTRPQNAPKRLPEKGDIDYVPYDKIDTLWASIQIALARGLVKEPAEVKKLKDSSERMEEALASHFEFLNITEMGQTSARLV